MLLVWWCLLRVLGAVVMLFVLVACVTWLGT